MKLRGRVLESIFADPTYQQVVMSVLKKEWGILSVTEHQVEQEAKNDS